MDISLLLHFKPASWFQSTYVQGNNKSVIDVIGTQHERPIENSNMTQDNEGSSSGRNQKRKRKRFKKFWFKRGADRDRGPRTGDRNSRGSDRERALEVIDHLEIEDLEPIDQRVMETIRDRGPRPSGDRKPRPSGDN